MATKTSRKPRLTRRQEEYLALFGDGMTNDEVGEALGVTSRTAKAYVEILCRKFDVPLKRHLIERARWYFEHRAWGPR